MKYLQDALQTFVSFKWSKVRLIITFFFFPHVKKTFLRKFILLSFCIIRQRSIKRVFEDASLLRFPEMVLMGGWI